MHYKTYERITRDGAPMQAGDVFDILLEEPHDQFGASMYIISQRPGLTYAVDAAMAKIKDMTQQLLDSRESNSPVSFTHTIRSWDDSHRID